MFYTKKCIIIIVMIIMIIIIIITIISVVSGHFFSNITFLQNEITSKWINQNRYQHSLIHRKRRYYSYEIIRTVWLPKLEKYDLRIFRHASVSGYCFREAIGLSQRRSKTFIWLNYIGEMMSAEKWMVKQIQKKSSKFARA